MVTSASSGLRWRKSSRSDEGNNANCVEVAVLARGVGLRDSKNATGPVITVPAASWRCLLKAVS